MSQTPVGTPAATLPLGTADNDPLPLSPVEGGNSLLRSSDRNPPQQGFLCLRQRQCEHPVLDLRTDLVLIDLVRHREGARVRPHIVLSIDWLHTLIFREVDLSIHPEDVVFQRYVDILLLHTRHFHHNRDRLIRFMDVRVRDVVAARDGLLLLAHQFFLLVNRQFLRSCCHHALRSTIGLSAHLRPPGSFSACPARHAARTALARRRDIPPSPPPD